MKVCLIKTFFFIMFTLGFYTIYGIKSLLNEEIKENVSLDYKETEKDLENKSKNENISDCEIDGLTTCQVVCSPAAKKVCKKVERNKVLHYCCSCEFYNGEFKSLCLPIMV